MKHLKLHIQSGFTLVELMIATAVFATVLLLCTYGLLEIGRSYYKGATISRTQETARVIADDVVEAIQFGSGEVFSGTNWYCVGNKRYSFVLNTQRRDTAPTRAHVLISDTVSSCSSTIGRNNSVDTTNISGTDAKELMNMRMRLDSFQITQIAGSDDLYQVRVRVISGDDDMIETVAGQNVCRNDRLTSQFCAVAELNTVARKRI